MAMQVPKALAGRDGTTLSVGIFIALVYQATLLPIAQYISGELLSSSDSVENVGFKEGIIVPLVTFVVAFIVLELVLWLMDSVKKS